MNENSINLIPEESLTERIFMLRGQKVMIDADLARLYGVTTSRLNEQVKRNLERFPEDFMFQLTWEEAALIPRSQFAILESGENIKYLPYAFTEHGVAMLSSVLRSPRAIAVNIHIMRTFAKLRQMLATHADLARKLEALEAQYKSHTEEFKEVWEAIRELLNPPAPKSGRRLGFRQSSSDKQEGFSRHRPKSH